MRDLVQFLGKPPRDVLLVGNGPSILDRPCGWLIDSFDGAVVRFNEFVLEPLGYTGTKTDLWVIAPRSHSIEHMHPELVDRMVKVPRRIQYADKDKGVRSTGIATMFWLLELGYRVVLHGFDHFALDRRKNYYKHDNGSLLCKDYVAGKPYHDKDKEMVEEVIAAGQSVCYFM